MAIDRTFRNLRGLERTASTRRVLELAALTAPPLNGRRGEGFLSLGEQCGAISHRSTYWRYRFPAAPKTRLSVFEALDSLADFRASITEAERAH